MSVISIFEIKNISAYDFIWYIVTFKAQLFRENMYFKLYILGPESPHCKKDVGLNPPACWSGGFAYASCVCMRSLLVFRLPTVQIPCSSFHVILLHKHNVNVKFNCIWSNEIYCIGIHLDNIKHILHNDLLFE